MPSACVCACTCACVCVRVYKLNALNQCSRTHPGVHVTVHLSSSLRHLGAKFKVVVYVLLII